MWLKGFLCALVSWLVWARAQLRRNIASDKKVTRINYLQISSVAVSALNMVS